ncbi:MAG: DNA-binding protein WhiA [Firmicutes bacterium]|jgi:DNA-binding protein WhiA|nr:DNA-binding protein WhiA [Bacillota bacterium]
MLSFALQVKNELARSPLAKRCCSMAEIKAFIQANGFLVIGENARKILIPTEYAPIARRLFKLFKHAFKITPDILICRKNRLQKKNSFLIQVSGEGDLSKIFQELSFPFFAGGGSNTEFVEKKVLEDVCCRRAYLRGLFLAGGSLTNPEREYHLEIVVPYESYAEEIVRMLSNFSLKIRYFRRKGDFVLYLKDGEKIGDFLRIVAAHSGLLNFENIRVVKGVRNQINRLVNCETANLTKTIFASQDQIQNIRLIQETIGLENIPPSLREVAELRLSYPEATLKELGDLAEPALTKSSINHRLRRLNALALKIKDRKQGNLPYAGRNF